MTECTAKGYLTSQDVNGLDIGFGKPAAHQLIQDISFRRGSSDWLTEGVEVAAGHNSSTFAMPVKGWNFRPMIHGVVMASQWDSPSVWCFVRKRRWRAMGRLRKSLLLKRDREVA